MKPKKYFRVKYWDKFSYPMQRALLKKYDIILTDHKTNLEFARDLAKKFSIKGLQKAIDKFDHTVEQFDAAKNFKIFPDESEIRNFAPERDYTPLTGKDKNISFWG